MTKKKEAYSAFINYQVTGYSNGMTADGAITLYFFADSFGEAAEKAFENFEAYRKCQTSPNSKYYGLFYEIVKVGIGKA